MFAYFTSQIMNIEGKIVKNPITVADLVNPLSGEPDEEKRTNVDDLMEKFKNVL